jgi:ABC transporter substrate binding protein
MVVATTYKTFCDRALFGGRERNKVARSGDYLRSHARDRRKQITATVPLVCTTLVDPVGLGLAASYSRPGGRLTGIVFQVDDLQAKMLELALEAMPWARNIGTLASETPPECLEQIQVDFTHSLHA